ncbi:MAG: hypothetical protein AAB340_02355 [Patescibacteria group bacterium]
MAESIFLSAAQHLPEPHRSLALKMDEELEKDRFNNYVIAGSYDGKSSCEIVGYWLIGLASGLDNLPFHHFISYERETVAEQAEFKFFKQIKEATHNIDLHKSADGLSLVFTEIAEIVEQSKGIREAVYYIVKGVRAMIGSSETSVIGALTMQKVSTNSNPFVALWQDRQLSRFIVEWLIKKFLA